MASKKRIITGVEKAYFAILKDETGTVPVYEPVSYLQGLQEFSITVNEETSSIYAENRVWESENALGEIEVSLTFTSIFTPDYVALLGKKLSTMGGIIENVNDEPPYIALMLEKTLSGGVKEYLTLYKGKLRIPEDVARTKEGTTEFQVKTLAGTFMPLNNGLWKHVFRNDDIGFVAGRHDVDWGKKVIIPTAMVTPALTVTTSTPAAPGTGQAATVKPTVTFSNRIVSHVIDLTKDATGGVQATVINATGELNTAGTLLTVTPATQLQQGAHTLRVIGKDMYGQTVEHIGKFTVQ